MKVEINRKIESTEALNFGGGLGSMSAKTVTPKYLERHIFMTMAGPCTNIFSVNSFQQIGLYSITSTNNSCIRQE
jgi:hypothetical protein